MVEWFLLMVIVFSCWVEEEKIKKPLSHIHCRTRKLFSLHILAYDDEAKAQGQI